MMTILIELGGFHTHRAIDICWKGGDAARAGQLADVVEQALRAPNREGRNEHFLFVPQGFAQDAGELFDGLVDIAVIAIAVGRFANDQIGRSFAGGRIKISDESLVFGA